MNILEDIQYTLKNSPFYKNQISGDISSITDIRPTDKKNLSEKTQEFICVDQKDIIETVSTSGTTGKPIYIRLTKNDLNRLKAIEVANFSKAAFNSEDNVQLMTTSDKLFIAGQAYYEALQEVNCNVIRTGSGNSLFQIKTARELCCNAVVSVPSYLIKLGNIDKNWGKQIKKAVLVGESIISENMTLNSVGEKIKSLYPDCDLFSSYGNTEIQGSFCGDMSGLYANKKFFYVEILDENNQSVEEGTHGEITVTTIGVTGMPLIRYKTGDISFWKDKEEQITGPVIGRKNQLIKAKGTSIFPSAITNTLTRIQEVFDFVIKVTKNGDGNDNVVIYADIDHPRFINRIKEEINAETKITPLIQKVSLNELEKIREPYKTRKKIFFIDNR